MERKRNNRDIIILISLIVVLILINYPFLDRSLENFVGDSFSETATIERIIDGDTVESNGTSIRLLGINAPERGEFYHEESKSFLEELVLNETVRLEFVGEREDRYYRTLGYIHFNGENINVKMVEEGFANYYFYDGRDKYSDDLETAWGSCLEKEINLCERSEHACSVCIEINRNKIVNECSFSCDIDGWEIKSEGRDKVEFNGTLGVGESHGFELDLSDSGGSLFLRDDVGRLVGWRKL